MDHKQDGSLEQDTSLDQDIYSRRTRSPENDGLVPLQSLNLEEVKDFDEMLEAMALTAFGGRNLGEAAEVLEAMILDPRCSVVLTLSGAMTVGKMGMVITEMVERGWVQAIISTGALMTHGLVELAGMGHYKALGEISDRELFKRGYNRIYDSYEVEVNLNTLHAKMLEVFEQMSGHARFGSRHLCAQIGKSLDKPDVRGIMVACYRAGVPIYIPGFTDSELGLDFATWLLEKRLNEEERPLEEYLMDLRSPFDPFLDLGHYGTFITKSPHIGIFTIGGGVPRNWAQQAPPFIDIVNVALKRDLRLNRFRYGVRICPEPVHWGGLSGCTYSEGISWGKFIPKQEGGKYAEVHADATMVWPLLVKGVAQRLAKRELEAQHPSLDMDGCRPNVAPRGRP